MDAQGVWRVALPPQPATATPATIALSGSDGSTASLKDVLFGDVILCSGQSNMQYTPHSMAGMNNLTAELAAADAYADSIRFFTVGQDTHCGDPKRGQTDCSQAFTELNDNITGGAGGIGYATCVAMADRGANVVAVDQSLQRLERLQQTFAERAAAGEWRDSIVLGLDVTSEEDMATMAEAAVERFGRIDVLINNASAIDNSDTLTLRPKKYDLMHAVNARGAYTCANDMPPWT